MAMTRASGNIKGPHLQADILKFYSFVHEKTHVKTVFSAIHKPEGIMLCNFIQFRS